MNDEIRQAIADAKERQPVAIDLSWYQGTVELDDIKQYIRANINSASRSFVAIGYYLKYVRDNELFKEDGYQNIWEFGKDEFGIGKSSASRFMAINDRFSKDGNSPVLLDQYKDFSSSKLSEMLTMTDEQMNQVTVATTRAEIREMKQPILEEVVAPAQQEPSQDKPIGEEGCTGECFWCADSECNNYQIPRVNCLFDTDIKCSIYGAHTTAITTLDINCVSSCCMGCKEDCGARCNHSVMERYKAKQTEPESEDDITEKECGNYNYNDMDPNEYCVDLPETEDFPCNVCDNKLNRWEPKVNGIELDCYSSDEGWHKEVITDDPEPTETVEAGVVLDEEDPCNNCGHARDFCCNYPETEDDYCIMGDKWVPQKGEAVEAEIVTTEPKQLDLSAFLLAKIDELIETETSANNGDGGAYVQWVISTLETVKELINQWRGV